MRLFLPFALFLSLPLLAQDIDSDLGALNALYTRQVRFKIDKQHRLVADFFDASGHYRQDMVYVEFLHADSIRYTPAEQAVTMRCRQGQDKCFDKEIFKLNSIRSSGRMNLPLVPGDAEGTQAIAALATLVRHAQEQLMAADETKRGGDRMKGPDTPGH